MVEIIPKPIEEVPLWQKILFYLPIVILLVTIFTYPVLVSLEKKSQTTLQNLENSLARAKTSQMISLEQELLNYQRKIRDFTPFLDEHIFASKIFEFLEKKTHPKIFFSKIDLNSRDSNVTLLGEADNFLILGQQILILEEDPLIKELTLSQVSIGKEGEIDFSLNFSFDPQILKY